MKGFCVPKQGNATGAAAFGSTFLRLVHRLAGGAGHPAVQLGDHLEGGVHGQHGHAGVQGVDVPLRHEAGHGAAAALVYLAQLRHLPDYLRVVQQAADIGHRLRARVGGSSLAHVIEPQYPGVVEHYINLEKYYDSAGLQSVRAAVMEDMIGYKQHYKRCYRCLSAAAELDCDVRELLLTKETQARLLKRAKGIIARELKGSGSGGGVTQRFLGAVTHAGRVCCWESVDAQCKRVYALCDSFGLAHTLLTPVLAAATARGYDVIACPDPMAPDRLAHLLIPELSLAFVSSCPGLEYPGHPYRRIRLETMLESELYRRVRPRVRFTRKVSAALKEEAVGCLSLAKAQHDALEEHYNPYVDFDGVYDRAEALAAELFPVTASPQLHPAD